MTQTVLVTGASGRAGSHAVKAFNADGWRVRIYDRNTDLVAAAMGADVIYNGMNPPNYNNWAKHIPMITKTVIRAAKASGACILMPGTVYVFGDQPGRLSHETPHRGTARKGRIRSEMEAAFKVAASDGVQTILLRGGDFIDPDNGTDAMEMVYLRSIAKGRIVYPGDPDAVRSHCYQPDFARAAVALANRREQLAAYEDVCFPGHNFSVRDLKTEVQRLTGRKLTLKPFPWWLIRVASPFSELFREMLEMRYLWNLPHQLDPTKFDALLPEFHSTSLECVLRTSLARVNAPTTDMQAVVA